MSGAGPFVALGTATRILHVVYDPAAGFVKTALVATQGLVSHKPLAWQHFRLLSLSGWLVPGCFVVITQRGMLEGCEDRQACEISTQRVCTSLLRPEALM